MQFNTKTNPGEAQRECAAPPHLLRSLDRSRPQRECAKQRRPANVGKLPPNKIPNCHFDELLRSPDRSRIHSSWGRLAEQLRTPMALVSQKKHGNCMQCIHQTLKKKHDGQRSQKTTLHKTHNAEDSRCREHRMSTEPFRTLHLTQTRIDDNDGDLSEILCRKPHVLQSCLDLTQR